MDAEAHRANRREEERGGPPGGGIGSALHGDPPYPPLGAVASPVRPSSTAQNSGRLAGTPVRRGYRAGHGIRWTTT